MRQVGPSQVRMKHIQPPINIVHSVTIDLITEFSESMHPLEHITVTFRCFNFNIFFLFLDSRGFWVFVQTFLSVT